MNQIKRYRLALASYWFLFILVPTTLAFFILGLSAGVVGVFVILAIIGERAFRPWKRLWGVD
jgi:hypothetical protein